MHWILKITDMRALCLSAMLTVICLPISAADFFPVKTGSFWRYTYEKKTSLLDTVVLDSGFISWQIIETAAKHGDTAEIRIHQKKTVMLVFKGGQKKLHTYHDTLTLLEKSGGNRVWFSGDAGWTFLHHPGAGTPLPPPRVSAEKSTLTAAADSLDALRISPVIIREKGSVPMSVLEQESGKSFILLGADVGMLRYVREYQPQAPGEAFFCEVWELDSASLPHQ